MIGSLIGHFRILDLLGKGGMGEVYRAEDTKLGRTVAIKFLAPDLADKPVLCERFLREARAIAALNHPHICSIYETGEHDGRPFFVMEYLEGQNLKEVVAEGPLDQEALDRMAMQLADALAAAHDKGILHRDLKPANVIRDTRGSIKLLDFGLAKDLGSKDAVHSADVADDDATMAAPPPALTQAGATLGTYAYMSPEQLRGEELDQRSDLFALGLVLYELATGQRAIAGDTMALLIDRTLNQPVPPPDTIRPDLSQQSSAVIQRLIAKDRDERFHSADEVRQALMMAEPVPAKAPVQGDDQAFLSLSTLGAKRSPRGVILGIVGVILLAAWFGLEIRAESAAESPSPDSGEFQYELLALLALILVAAGGLTWWWEGRRNRRQRTEGKLRITRLEEKSSHRAWLFGYLFAWAAALYYTVDALLILWRTYIRQDTDSPTRFLFFGIPFVALMWFVVIKSKKWRDDPPARRSQEIEIRASYAQILSRISRIIAELGAQVTGMNLEEGLVRATTGANLKSLGSRLSFRVTEKSAELFVVEVASEPVLPMEILEFGNNKANVRQAVEFLVRE